MIRHGIAAATAAAAMLFAFGAQAGDLDGDGVADGADNCASASNGDQYDADGDGAGNACDTDYNNDGVTDESDAAIIQAALGTTEGDEGFDARADHDGDGSVLVSDFGIFLGLDG